MESSLIFGASLGLLAFGLSSVAQASILDGEMSNPASIHSLLSPEHPIAVEIGVEYLHPSLPDISNIVVENSSTSTTLSPGQTKTGTVNGNYPDTIAQTLKVQALLDAKTEFTVGVKTFLPLDGLSQIDTGNIYQPEFALYRSEGQRPRVLLSSGIDLGPDWRMAAAADVGFSVNAEANVFLQSGNGSVSDQRISAKIKPSLLPQLSLQFLQDYSLTARAENKSELQLSTTAGAQIYSGLASVDFSYTTQSALFYEPWEFEFNGKNKLTSDVTVKYGVSYQLWSGYEPRAAVIQSAIPVSCPAGAGNCTPQFSSGVEPSFKARNIFVPEAAFDFALGRGDTLEVGYRFKDSIFEGLPTGTGNYLDPPRHDGIVQFTHLTEKGWTWNIHGQLSRLTTQNVVKSDPTEIGGPGYSASGWLYGGGD